MPDTSSQPLSTHDTTDRDLSSGPLDAPVRRLPLTDAAARAAQPKDRPYKLWDRQGLYLQVQPSGAKGWRWKYAFQGRERRLSFGPYPLVSLQRARRDRDQARLLVRDGTDPQHQRRCARLSAAGDTFLALAEEWLAVKQKHRAPSTRKKLRWFLDALLLPLLGARRVVSIEPRDVLTALKTIEARGKYETAHRAREIIGQIFRYGIALGKAERDMAADVGDALIPVPRGHHAALIEPREVGRLLRALETLPPQTSVGAALRLAPYVFARPGELRTMEWAELDLEGALWRIPAAKMKLRKEHFVPLAAPVVRLLRARQAVAENSEYVFPSPRARTRPLSDNALNAALRALGYTHDQHTAHGFRTTARTLLSEQLGFGPDVTEVQLSHQVPTPLGVTYNRAIYLEQRTAMMAAWATYLDGLRATLS